MIKILFFYFIIFYSFTFSKELITPIPLNPDYDHKKAQLGKKLFFDTRLSKDNSISCASCHFIDNGGDDNIPFSFGINGKKGTRNSPTVLNARYNFVQFWDGSAKDLQEQAKGPIHNPVEMGSNFNEIISKLSKDDNYKKEFSAIYDNGITGLNITDAIAEFEKALTTPNSRFDQFLRGNKKALSKDELKGYKAFKEYGCISCHNGINIGGNLFQKAGIVKDFKMSPKEFGRFTVTKNKKDLNKFKVPSLRNIELTAPYFHDGRTDSLKTAVEYMLYSQVGLTADEKDIDNIIKFLKTLTGEIPAIMVKQ